MTDPDQPAPAAVEPPALVEPPPHPWLPRSAVLSQLGLSADSPNAPAAELARTAAAAHVEQLRRDLLSAALLPDGLVDVQFRADAATVQGAVLLASRLYARRGSPQGLASFGEFGPQAVMRLDPDVERLLRVGRWAPPQAR